MIESTSAACEERGSADAVTTRAGPRAAHRWVAWIASALFCAVSFWPRTGPAKYRYSFVFLVAIVWGVFALRRRLALRPLHFALFASALLLHDLGAFGWYSRRFAGLQFDWCVHFYFGLVGGLILIRSLTDRLRLTGAVRGLLVVLVVTGIGGFHEIVEALSTLVLGEQYGMLHMGPDSQLDTQQDLLANVLGACAAVAMPRLAAAGRAGR